MGIKIKPCHQCWRSYDLKQFRGLELVAIDESDGAETRRCRQCDTEITVDVRALGGLDLRDPLEMLDDRMAERRRRPIAVAIAVAAAVLLALVAFRLWSH